MSQDETEQRDETSAPLIDLTSPGFTSVSPDTDKTGRSISTDEQLKGYAHFLEKLKHSSALPLVERVKLFVARFPRELRREQATERLHRFIALLEAEVDKAEVFATSSEEERQDAKEGLEKLILKPLHQHFFRIDPDDRILDEELSGKILRIAPLIKLHEHLHGPVELVDDSLLDLAIEEMRRMDAYRAPRDKLQCILNAFRVIRHALDTVIGPSAWGADQLLPVCIYTIIRSNPPALNSNVNFIASFRHPSRLRGEDEYLLMQMNIAIRDIMDIEEVLLKPLGTLTITDVARMHKRMKRSLHRLVDDSGDDDKWEKLLDTEWQISNVEKFVDAFKLVIDEFSRRYN